MGGGVQVFEQLADETRALPWDDGHLASQDRKKLGMFRKPILKLLRRDPAARATAREFCTECSNLFTTNPLSAILASAKHEEIAHA